MSRILCIANQKGGVGKTTTAINLAECLSRANRRTLLLDIDPQCNATSGFGFAPLDKDSHPFFIHNEPWNVASVVEPGRLSVLPGSRSLAQADSNNQFSNFDKVSYQLRQLMQDYEYVLFDCPPSLGWLTRLALEVCTEVFIPIQCEYYAMEGLSQMVDAIRQLQSKSSKSPSIGGIVLTMFDPSVQLAKDVSEEVIRYFGDQVYSTFIPRDTVLAEAPSHGLSVLNYAPRSRGARAYVELCLEVIDRG